MRDYYKQIKSTECFRSKNGRDSVVYLVRWQYVANEQELDISKTLEFETELDTENTESFTEYSELTQEQVIDWIESTLTDQQKNEYKSKLDKKMDSVVFGKFVDNWI